MKLIIALLCAVGIATDIVFIINEYAGKMAKAALFKGLASLFFVILGAYCLIQNYSLFGLLVFIGLFFGMVGDVFLNLRNLYEGSKSMKVFAVGIAAFILGHFLYIAALAICGWESLPAAGALTILLGVAFIPMLMKKITPPSDGMKIFGYVYLFIVIAMFSAALMLFLLTPVCAMTAVFAIAGFLFVVSDFIMIYYSFGKKIKPLRAINLLTYYFAQLMIAVTILLR